MISASESFWLCLQDIEGLSKVPRENRDSVVQDLMARLEALIEQGHAEGHLSKNEDSTDLMEDNIPYLLAHYYLGRLISDYIHENRSRALSIASNNLIRFLEITHEYGVLPHDSFEELQLFLQGDDIPDKNETTGLAVESYKNAVSGDHLKQAMVSRARAQASFRLGVAIRQTREELARLLSSTNRDDFKKGQEMFPKYLQLLLEFGMIESFRELRMIKDEQRMLAFEKNSPDQASKLRDERLVAEETEPNSRTKKNIDMVSLTEDDVKRMTTTGNLSGGILQINDASDLKRLEAIKQEARKQGAIVPKDCIELLKEGNEKAAIAEDGGYRTTRDVLQQADGLRLDPEAFKSLNLVYGGGNPYTGDIPGDPSGDYRNVCYKVTRTETMQPGTKEDEPDEDKPPSDFSDDEEMHRLRRDDDENDGRKRGWGNRHHRL
ncbi:TAP42-like family protein [Giardia muris]|uniref:TAP42-like family protein n=1 Tax=Giardia muris TaxID=5742 RepID=A0A4Z1SV34_GIAMU|nr:TAP42-like family protein [Giardia muris]|eukprot:TNJ29676.1 TAP42-like family protein [Giardia muris]